MGYIEEFNINEWEFIIGLEIKFFIRNNYICGNKLND